MTEEQINKLIERCPDLFQKSRYPIDGVGSGWYNIIGTLCVLISYRVNNARTRLHYAMEHPESKSADSINQIKEELAKEIDNLPTIVQVKEKFGTLRFYVDSGTPEMHSYIEFAEALSSTTCEVCGAPGTRRTEGWVKTLCETHHIERQSNRT